MGYRLGIDLGTAFTAAAYVGDSRPEPQMLELGHRQVAIPSVLFVNDDGSLLFGEAAERRAAAQPDRVIREYKRRFGDEVPILAGGRSFNAVELQTQMLRWVLDNAEQRLPPMREHAVVTHPANWGPYKLKCMREMLAEADISSATLLPEPVAAAINFAASRDLPADAKLLIYDLGGGTFDIAIVENTPDGFQLRGTPLGLEHTGGADFDEAVLAYAIEQLGPSNLDPDDQDVARGLIALRRESTEAKEALSTDTSTQLTALLPGAARTFQLTRRELEDLIRPALDETVATAGRALRLAELEPTDLHAVVLVGGSSRIPLVTELLNRDFGVPVILDTYPKNTIALGAARHASALGTSRPTSKVTSPRPTPSATLKLEDVIPDVGDKILQSGPRTSPSGSSAAAAAATAAAAQGQAAAAAGSGRKSAARPPKTDSTPVTATPATPVAPTPITPTQASRTSVEPSTAAVPSSTKSGPERSASRPSQPKSTLPGQPKSGPPAAAPDSTKSGGRPKWLIPAIVVAVLALIGGGIAFANRPKDNGGTAEGPLPATSGSATPASPTPSNSPSGGGNNATPLPPDISLPVGAPISQDIALVPMRTSLNAPRHIYLLDTTGNSKPVRLAVPKTATEPAGATAKEREKGLTNPTLQPSRTSILIRRNLGLWLMDSQGKHGRQLKNKTPGDCANIVGLSWSQTDANTAVIACEQGDSHRQRLRVIDLNGKLIRTLATTGGGLRTGDDVTISPDGKKVLYWATKDTKGDGGNLFTANLDGTGKPKQLTHGSKWRDGDPAWSPDGSQIAFRRIPAQGSGDSNVLVMNADGTNQRKVGNTKADDIKPSWSPDGTRLLVVSNRKSANSSAKQTNWGLWLINVSDGAVVKRLNLEGPEITTPTWDYR